MGNIATLTSRPTILGWAYYAEEGTTVDGITVAAENVGTPKTAGKPDGDELANWTSLGAVEMHRRVPKTQDQQFLTPDPSGIYVEEESMNVVAEDYMVRVNQHTPLVWRLESGAAAAIVADTPFVSGEQIDRKVRGWFKFINRVQGGDNLRYLDWWADIRLAEVIERSSQVAVVMLRMRKLVSSLNAEIYPDNT
jgi:hypothetical protein